MGGSLISEVGRSSRVVRGLAVAAASLGWALAVPAIVHAAPDPQGTIYVADYFANRVDVFAPGASGDVAPIRTIGGSNTGILAPVDLAVDAAGDLYVSNFGASITEYAPGASGNVAPIRTIAGPATGLAENDDMALAPDGTLYVGNFTGPITIYAPGAGGDVAPVRTITTLNAVDGLGVDATGTLYADDSNNGAIDVFAPGASGNATPIRTIAGPSTNLSLPDDVKVGFGGQLFVSDENNSVEVFAAGANGNAAPTQSISGSNTSLTEVDDLALDAGGNIYVTNFNGSVSIFSGAANGNATPSGVIAGPSTTLQEPEGVAVAGPVSGATMTTAVQSAAISLGNSTQDTATLAGANSPTGSIVFNLYGPSDPNCVNVPAFTSAPGVVSGNGTYSSPAFTPSTAGTYSWVAEYSGDNSNPPITTACNDPAETVTVSASGELPITATGNDVSSPSTQICADVARFIDPDPAALPSDYSATINWGDGTTTTATIKAATHGRPHFEVRGCHTYAAGGQYGLTVTITDLDGSGNNATTSSGASIGNGSGMVSGPRASARPVITFAPHAAPPAGAAGAPTPAAAHRTAHHRSRHRARVGRHRRK